MSESETLQNKTTHYISYNFNPASTYRNDG